MFSKFSVGAAVLVLFPLSVNAQDMVNANDPERVADLIRDIGYRANIGEDSVGDPLISSSAHGYDFDVFFHGCDEDGLDCRSLRFYTRFDMVDGISLTRVHEYNLEKRWVKVYTNDESDPVVEMDYNLYGGVSVENFNDTFDWWLIQMEDFIEYIEF